ncbi:MAG: 3-deoxy-8-phosphooctulonate synthase [Gemmatimonadetes bacterium]|nr:3-deoxy-8-phosphooctulonate synthase [Gemmatimonadota bacterium]
MAQLLQGRPLVIAGPCVLEDGDVNLRIAERLVRMSETLGIDFIYKASFDKANRARFDAPRGPGLDRGLEILSQIGRSTGLPLLTDVHEPSQVKPCCDVVDVLQIPAFLCRQTDLLTEVGRCGKSVNIKKGQWMKAEDMVGAVEKVRSGGCTDVAVSERGTFFGYGDLVVDMRNFDRLRDITGCTVVFDMTHSVQRPGSGSDGSSGGSRENVRSLAAAAAAAGADGFFIETHPEPDNASSDADTIWPLEELEPLLAHVLELWRTRERCLSDKPTTVEWKS